LGRSLRRRGDAGDTQRTFLANHREALVAFDFFTVPTVTFQLLLYCFFVIERERRKIRHFNGYRSPECGVGRPTTARYVSRG
jgi:hypothetical protein